MRPQKPKGLAQASRLRRSAILLRNAIEAGLEFAGVSPR